jgi:hypothetical protein
MRTSAKKLEIAGLGATARRIAAWRATRRVGSPMPERLWGEAVRLAQIHGVRAAAVGLGVDYGKLRKLATGTLKGLVKAGRARRESGVVRENLFSLKSLAISRAARIAQWSGTSRSCWSGRCAPPSEAATQLCWRTSR